MESLSYRESDIEVYEGLDGVRKRPEMYIGDVDKKGFHHILWEVVDNAVDESNACGSDEIILTLHDDQSISVEDFGRGIPIGIVEKTGKSGVLTVLTVLHAGGKFGGNGYGATGGLHGVGVSVTNALSEWLEVRVRRECQEVNMRLEKGLLASEQRKWLAKEDQNRTGTYIRFMPDQSIFNGQKWDVELVVERLKRLSYLNNIRFVFVNGKEQQVFYHGGIRLEVGINALSKFKGRLANPIVFQSHMGELAVQVVNDPEQSIFSFVNNIPTPLGGSHETGFKSGFTRFWKQVSKIQLKSEELLRALCVLISVKKKDARFEGQTKEKLAMDRKLEGEISSFVYQSFMEMVENDPVSVKSFVKEIESVIDEQNKPEDDGKKDEVKLPEQKFTSKKLVSPIKKDKTKNELFIVEGDSAGGSAKGGKNEYQGVLSLRGKPINIEKKKLKKVLENEEISSIAYALGGIGDGFDIEKCPYISVIIMTDADKDGLHIQMILLTLFYRYYRPLIESGRLYIAQPPLYVVRTKNKSYYALNDEELNEITSKVKGKYEVGRFKGLGEMNAADLMETTMNPEHRTLVQITAENIEEVEKWIVALMGTNVKQRKEFLEEVYS